MIDPRKAVAPLTMCPTLYGRGKLWEHGGKGVNKLSSDNDVPG